jgi:hypothetical protein
MITRSSKNRIAGLVDIGKGTYKTLILHAQRRRYGKKRYQPIGNFIVKEGDVVLWLDEETKFTNYSTINLN